jgi:predicted acetyltransferase
MLKEVQAEGLRYVEITTQPDNIGSKRVITANGGVLVEEFISPPSVGSRRELRYRIYFKDAGEEDA